MNASTKATSPRRSLSVVLPVHNRASTIVESLEELCRVLGSRPPDDWELMVVDDASDDATVERVLEFSRSHPPVLLLHNPSALGIGYSAKHGILVSQGERILLAAVDPPEPWSALRVMEESLADRFDLVVASERSGPDRPLPPVRIRSELLRRLVPLQDRSDRRGSRPDHFPFHLYRRNAALEIFGRQRFEGPGFALEALYLARRFQYRVLEVGIAQATSGGGRCEVGIGDLVRIRYNCWRGHYG